MEPQQRTPIDWDKVEMKMPESGIYASGIHTQPRLPRKEFGTLIWLLIVLLFLLLVALVIWYLQLSNQTSSVPTTSLRPTSEQNREPESRNAYADVGALITLSTSNELDAIETDLESTNLETLTSDLDRIEAELEAAMQSF